jgi:hypothetical protein
MKINAEDTGASNLPGPLEMFYGHGHIFEAEEFP